MYYLRFRSQKFFWKSLKFQTRHSKNLQCPLNKISLHYQNVIDDSLTVFNQLFSCTSVGPSKCQIDKMINSQGHLRVSPVFWMPCVLSENSSQNLFWMSLKFKIRHCKNFQCPLSKIILHHKNIIDQKLTVFHQLFSQTSVGPSKCRIDKMIVSQGYLTVWRVLWLPCTLDKNFTIEFFC